jgi:acyl-CoA hydrolase
LPTRFPTHPADLLHERPLLKDRIRYAPLRDKVTDPATAARHIQDGTNLFISGFTAGYPKLIPRELVRRATAGETFKINLFAGASTGDSVDGILAEAGWWPGGALT